MQHGYVPEERADSLTYRSPWYTWEGGPCDIQRHRFPQLYKVISQPAFSLERKTNSCSACYQSLPGGIPMRDGVWVGSGIEASDLAEPFQRALVLISRAEDDLNPSPRRTRSKLLRAHANATSNLVRSAHVMSCHVYRILPSPAGKKANKQARDTTRGRLNHIVCLLHGDTPFDQSVEVYLGAYVSWGAPLPLPCFALVLYLKCKLVRPLRFAETPCSFFPHFRRSPFKSFDSL